MYIVVEILPSGDLGEMLGSFETKSMAEIEINFLTKNNPGKEYALFDENGLAW